MGDAYDVAVIGAGTGGYSTALRAAELGLRVVLVERDDRIGGTCLIRGCIPTKALLQSAAVMDTVDRASEWGIKAAGEPDWTAIKAFEEKIAAAAARGTELRNKIRADAQRDMGARVEAERKRLASVLGAELEKLTGARDTALQAVQADASRMAELTATKLLGRGI